MSEVITLKEAAEMAQQIARSDKYHQNMERQIQIIYPYPPFLLMPDGTYIEMPDILTLVKMLYDLRKRVEELEAVHE